MRQCFRFLVLQTHGGDISAVQDQLRNMQQVQGTECAFAAILADGSAVTWGDVEYGGDRSAVQDRLRNVQQVQGTHGAFAAILADKSVVSWFQPIHGGDSSAVQCQFAEFQHFFCMSTSDFGTVV